MHQTLPRACACLVLLSLPGCKEILGLCGDQQPAHPAIVLNVADSVSGVTLTAPYSVIVTNPSGGTATIEYAHPVDMIATFGDLPGWYTVIVKSAGYVDWKRENISVGQSCGQLVSQQIAVKLQRQ